jgi:hypothetical protein
MGELAYVEWFNLRPPPAAAARQIGDAHAELEAPTSLNADNLVVWPVGSSGVEVGAVLW